MDERYERIKKLIEKRLNTSFDDLMITRRKIEIEFREKFSTYSIFGKFCFTDIVKNSKYGSEKTHWTLTEKCIRRDYNIKLFEVEFESDEKMLNEFSDVKILFEMINTIIPFEVFWAMEFKQADNELLSKTEQDVFKYLQALANIYLSSTDKYQKMFEEKELGKKSKK